MNKISLLFLPVLFFACYSSKQKTTKEIPPPANNSTPLFEKFVGTWENKTFGNYEKWEKINSDQYAAMAFILKGQDTVIQETVKVHKEAGNWIYEVAVIGQNDGQAIRFTADSFSDSQEVNFSNPAHDFPTDINYSFEHNAMKAFIAGKGRNGEMKKIPIVFERVH